MKVLSKQRNSRMCVMCGMDNPFGVKAQFYNMEDGSVITPFRFRPEHQSYPGRVHGGLISAMLDELGLRACWTEAEDTWGVTINLNVKYRKPVPYDTDLFGRGVVVKNSPLFFRVNTEILDVHGEPLASSEVTYCRMDLKKIAADADMHEEMHYYIEDDVREIHFLP